MRSAWCCWRSDGTAIAVNGIVEEEVEDGTRSVTAS